MRGVTDPSRAGDRTPPARPRARRRFGQHFLEPSWVRKVVQAISPDPGDVLLEIGPGRGALTEALAAAAARVDAIEVDRDLADLLRGRLPPNVHLVEGDVLEIDLSALARALRPHGAGSVRIVGNLPYNISSPILFQVIRAVAAGAGFRDATFMLQREVADRLLAPAGTREYGVLTVLVAVHAAVTRLLDLPPGAFRPPPAVRSSLVRLQFHPPTVASSLYPRFERVVRGVFQQRRKTVANASKGAFPDVDPARVAAALDAAGIAPGRRPETLEVTELTRLAELLPA
jgi:16S rRNA (adenine1518-N6/adenine1519-N6)-dimethyltransferase